MIGPHLTVNNMWNSHYIDREYRKHAALPVVHWSHHQGHVRSWWLFKSRVFRRVYWELVPVPKSWQHDFISWRLQRTSVAESTRSHSISSSLGHVICSKFVTYSNHQQLNQIHSVYQSISRQCIQFVFVLTGACTGGATGHIWRRTGCCVEPCGMELVPYHNCTYNSPPDKICDPLW